MNLLLTLIAALLVVGILLWAIGAMPWINPDIKKMINILVIVFAALWVISVIFPALHSVMPAALK